MATSHYPRYHVKDVWDAPDSLFGKDRGLLIGGGKAARMLGYSRVYLYQHADELDLTVYRWKRQHNGRYFLISEIEGLLKERAKMQNFGPKDLIRIAKEWESRQKKISVARNRMGI